MSFNGQLIFLTIENSAGIDSDPFLKHGRQEYVEEGLSRMQSKSLRVLLAGTLSRIHLRSNRTLLRAYRSTTVIWYHQNLLLL